MGWKIKVKVVDSDGNPRGGCNVTVHFYGTLGFGSYLSEDTDSDGWATIDFYNADDIKQHVEYIAVDHEEVEGESVIYDGETRSFTI